MCVRACGVCVCVCVWCVCVCVVCVRVCVGGGGCLRVCNPGFAYVFLEFKMALML